MDITTLQVGTLCILVTSSVAAPLIMGNRISMAARFGQGTVIAQTLGWASILVSGLLMQRWFATLGMALVSAGLVCQWHALQGWMGPRPGQRLMHALAVLVPLGYAIAFPSYALRVGWANVPIGSQMLLLCLALAWPSPQTSRRWRTLLGLCMAALAVVTLWRGLLGAFYTEAYPYFGAPHPVNLAGALIHSLAWPSGTTRPPTWTPGCSRPTRPCTRPRPKAAGKSGCCDLHQAWWHCACAAHGPGVG